MCEFSVGFYIYMIVSFNPVKVSSDNCRLCKKKKKSEIRTPTVFNIKYFYCYFMSMWFGWKVWFKTINVIKSLKVIGHKDVNISYYT